MQKNDPDIFEKEIQAIVYMIQNIRSLLLFFFVIFLITNTDLKICSTIITFLFSLQIKIVICVSTCCVRIFTKEYLKNGQH